MDGYAIKVHTFGSVYCARGKYSGDKGSLIATFTPEVLRQRIQNEVRQRTDPDHPQFDPLLWERYESLDDRQAEVDTIIAKLRKELYTHDRDNWEVSHPA